MSDPPSVQIILGLFELGIFRVSPLLVVALLSPLLVSAGLGYYLGESQMEPVKAGALSGMGLAMISVFGGILWAARFMGMGLSSVPFLIGIGTVWLLFLGLYSVGLGAAGGAVGDCIATRQE